MYPISTSFEGAAGEQPKIGIPTSLEIYLMANLSFTILGCGSSGGVPRLGGNWGDCDPSDIKNQRSRCSLLVERKGTEGITRVLIDTSPDMRSQLLKTNVEMLLGHELIGINENENCIDLKLHNLDNQEKVELTCN